MAETTLARAARPGATGPGDAAARVAAPQGAVSRAVGAFADRRAARRYAAFLGALVLAALALAWFTLAWDNPMPPGTRGFWLIAKLRATSLVVMAIVAVSQALATVAFQTVTDNRIITPSILGFESLYTAIQTTAVYLLGVSGVLVLQGTPQFLLQVALMVGLAVALYGTLLTGRRGNMQIMLLVGIVVGGGLGSVASFMRRLLSPSEFDVLAARMFGAVTNAQDEYIVPAIVLVALASALLLARTRRLNVLALGRDTAVNLGVDHRRGVLATLVLVSILIAVSTALVGPMTFFGFLVAALTYQAAGTHDHRYVLPMAALLGFVVLAGAYAVMNHVFAAQGVVSIIIELVGGTAFLLVILRKGRL